MPETTGKPQDGAPNPSPPEPKERLVTTEHKLALGRKTLAYTVTCGTLVLREYGESEDEKDRDADPKRRADRGRASVFFVAYTLAGVKDAAERPVTFAFNGGPGSSSVWLHLGLLGPQRVPTDEMGNAAPAPHRLVDNEHTLLTHSDLVFIDPVGTGHSRMAEGEKDAEYHDFQRDLDSIAEFIRLWLSRHGRWSSPIYLIGESYGTTRAAGLSHHLQEKHDIFLAGVMLVSLAVDLQTLSFDHGNDLPYPLFLPTYAATAWYHRALEPALQDRPLREVIAAAEAFAVGDYTVALMRGSRLPAAERERIAAQVAHFSGLTPEYVQRCDLRPGEFRFFKELLRARSQTVGRLDSRFLGTDRDDAGEQPESDAAMANLAGAYAAGINSLLHDTLQYQADEPYVVHAPLWKKWKWKDFECKYANVGASLRRAMQGNAAMRVYVASGWYDLATPHFAGDYTLSHLGLRDAQLPRITVSYFEAGHMMYIHRPSLVRLAGELREFVSTRPER